MAESNLTPEKVENPNRVSAMTLTRKAGESIHIGDDIVITITDVNPRSKAVRVRISAPRSTAVNRGENMVKIARGNLVAATDDTSDEAFLIEL